MLFCLLAMTLLMYCFNSLTVTTVGFCCGTDKAFSVLTQPFVLLDKSIGLSTSNSYVACTPKMYSLSLLRALPNVVRTSARKSSRRI